MNKTFSLPVPQRDNFVINMPSSPKYEKLELNNQTKLKQKAVGRRTLKSLKIGYIIFQFSIIMIIILILLITRSHVVEKESEIANIEGPGETNDKFFDPSLPLRLRIKGPI